jgi:Uma2 family endonuclease
MDTAVRKNWTQEEFFDWVENQDTRYEFDGFQPVAMTGGWPTADAINGRLITALNIRLSGAKCQPYGPNSGIETASKAVYFPDALVTCTEYDGESPTVPGAVVVFEIVGKTRDSINRDHVEKVADYATVPSILRYVIIESKQVLLTVRERATGTDPWKTPTRLEKLEDVLILPEIGIEIPVADLYKDIKFSGRASISP